MQDDERGFPVDDAPEGDAVEQSRPIDFDDETGLDTDYVAAAGDREANEADVIEQAYIVPTEDDRDDDR
jgi:hypothetical protein